MQAGGRLSEALNSAQYGAVMASLGLAPGSGFVSASRALAVLGACVTPLQGVTGFTAAVAAAAGAPEQKGAQAASAAPAAAAQPAQPTPPTEGAGDNVPMEEDPKPADKPGDKPPRDGPASL